jgi:hypothetical protein
MKRPTPRKTRAAVRSSGLVLRREACVNAAWETAHSLFMYESDDHEKEVTAMRDAFKNMMRMRLGWSGRPTQNGGDMPRPHLSRTSASC